MKLYYSLFEPNRFIFILSLFEINFMNFWWSDTSFHMIKRLKKDLRLNFKSITNFLFYAVQSYIEPQLVDMIRRYENQYRVCLTWIKPYIAPNQKDAVNDMLMMEISIEKLKCNVMHNSKRDSLCVRWQVGQWLS